MRIGRLAASLVTVTVAVGSGSEVAATTPPPGFVLQETVTLTTALTVQGSTIASNSKLLNGVTYKIRASGTFRIAGQFPCPFGDAEFGLFDASDQSPCRPLEDITPADGTDLGIGIDTPYSPGRGRKSPYWGPYDTSHVYTVDFVGSGAPIVLNYFDCGGCYGDNSGALTVEIFAPQQVPALAGWARLLLWVLLLSTALLAMRRRRLRRP